MNIHKETGFQNENIGPCPYGVFRTLDIPSMTPDQIYLWGLVTKPVSFWEERKEDKYGCNGFGIDENLEMIVDQYRKLLTSVLCSTRQEIITLIIAIRISCVHL